VSETITEATPYDDLQHSLGHLMMEVYKAVVSMGKDTCAWGY